MRFLIAIALQLWLFLPILGFSQELPKPSVSNSVVISIEHSPQDEAEVDDIKKDFDFGLYAWLSFSVTTLTPVLDWRAKLEDADKGIQGFKDQASTFVAAAKRKNVRLHLVVTSGLARGLAAYRAAKEEDLRNCQWYNDNKPAADDQVSRPDAMDKYVFGTLSRYARKVRANLEAKSKAMMGFLKLAFDENPETLLAVSGWGEAELNYHRLSKVVSLQEFFCDYSPFAVLEFRDWIQHAGLYDDARGPYKGQGFRGGGAQYQGDAGRIQFNADYGTSFTTWDLKYFDWSLADDYDRNPADEKNPDPHRIPASSYGSGGMMPQGGSNFIAGGFDPPRAMAPGAAFWDLWHFFRETMVANFVKDAARWAREAGISASQWFSHQIPGDYLYGKNPDSPHKNGRYYSSASPLWTADVTEFASPGVTMYDVKFPESFARTSLYALEAMSRLAPVWAILEYGAEAYPQGMNVSQSDPEMILEQYMRAYGYGPYLVNFWRWIDATGESQIKGTNKETALRKFVRLIRDKARSKDTSVVYSPPQVGGFSGAFAAAGNAVELKIGEKIWTGGPWAWKDWGDFSKFEIFKGTSPNVPVDAGHRLATTSTLSFKDTTVSRGITYYYKVRAVNVKNVAGPSSSEIIVQR